MKTQGKFMGLGVLSALTASLCCITPLLALLTGTSSLSSSFSFLEPYRYILIAVTVFVLGLAWFQKIRTDKQRDCDCETDKQNFFQRKPFLFLVTIFAVIMLAFPYFSNTLYSPQDKTQVVVSSSSINNPRIVEFGVKGMTCSGCEAHVEQEVNQLNGIISVKASYNNSNAVVVFDTTKINANSIEAAIIKTGYKVTDQKR